MLIQATTLLDRKEISLTFTDKPVTPWGGLAVFAQFAERLGLPEALRKAVPFTLTSPNATDPVEVLVAFLSGVLVGSRRFSHIERLRQDEVVRTMLGMERFASDTTLTRFFGRFRQRHVEEMFTTLESWMLGKALSPAPPFAACTLDLDSSVFERYGHQEGAKRGYNPRKPGRPSHHPILAVLAENHTIVHAWLRSGNTASSEGVEQFLRETLALLPREMAVGAVRADSGFGHEPFLAFVERLGLPHAVAARFTKGLQGKITTITDWTEIAPGIAAGEVLFQAQGWSRSRRVVVIREHAPELEEARGRQLFDDPAYRYQAVITSMDKPCEEVWRFYRGRADVENRIKELKWDYGVDGFCLKKFFPTEAAFRLVCLLHNLLVLMEKKMGLAAHRTLATLRHELFTCGAILGRAGNRTLVRLSLQGPWRERFVATWRRLFPTVGGNCVAVESG